MPPCNNHNMTLQWFENKPCTNYFPGILNDILTTKHWYFRCFLRGFNEGAPLIRGRQCERMQGRPRCHWDRDIRTFPDTIALNRSIPLACASRIC